MINVITLKQRQQQVTAEMEKYTIEYFSWPAIIVENIPFAGISLAHKHIVAYAKKSGLKRVVIAEDDIVFYGKGAYEYFISQIPEDYDIFLGMIYEGSVDDQNRIKDYWCGMTIYCVHERFYDQFLATNTMNHIDRELSKTSHIHKFIVCDKYVACQRDGYSFNKKKECSYGHLLEGKPIFGH